MGDTDYISIPACASRIEDPTSPRTSKYSPKVATAPPSSNYGAISPSSMQQLPPTPTKVPFNIASTILASGISIPSPSPREPRKQQGLLSTKEPLSLPITTANFRKFAAKSGPVFWFQDRVEEILTWKKGWKVTTAWMSAYAFLCFFPRCFLLVPHTIVLYILISAHSSRNPSPSRISEIPAEPVCTHAPEGSPEWFSNLQGIQNLMGVVSDTHDAILFNIVPHLTFSTPASYTLLAFTFLSFFGLLLILPFIPLRLTFLVGGLAPFALTHPLTQAYLPIILGPHIKKWHMKLTRFVDDDRLEDKHWYSELSVVELWENERLGASGGVQGWSKANLRPDERKGWTRGRDGWSQVKEDGTEDVSNLTFSLEPGWAFVETEDWRKDLEASWADVNSDPDGWVYTDNSWQSPQCAMPADWAVAGATRRRRWIRRIYRDSSA